MKLLDKKSALFFCYTALFAVMALCVFSFFALYGKSMVWIPDGLYQHYNAFIYLGHWVRSIIKTLIFSHELVIPTWEWGLGYGADVVTTLGYYNIGDPFALISVITPSAYAEIGYGISIILRFYTAGLAFMVYARHMNCRKWSTLLASVIYVFCQYSLYAGVRHPYFINPMIWLPLIFYGCEKILEHKSPAFFMIFTALAALSNFYFFYMIVLLTVIYVLVRSFSDEKRRQPKTFAINILKFFLSSIIALAAAAVIFLPNFMNFIGNSRVSTAYEYNLLYTLKDYSEMAGSLIGGSAATDWANVAMAPICYIGVIVSVINHRKEDRWARIYFVLEILFLLFPVAGYIFNGFGYVCNRWVFAWAFVTAFIFARSFPELFTMKKKQLTIVCFAACGYAILCLLMLKSRTQSALAGCVLMLVSLFVLYAICRLPARKTADLYIGSFYIGREWLLRAIAIGFTCLMIINMAFDRYSVAFKNYLGEFADSGYASQMLGHESSACWNMISDTDFYRIDNNTDATYMNFSISDHQSTTAYFWSLVNSNVTGFMEGNSIYTYMSQSVTGLNSRAWIMALLGARYYTAFYDVEAAEDAAEYALENGTEFNYEPDDIPYGYAYVNTAEGASGLYSLYESENTLPFGYTYDSVLSEHEYEQMSIAKRQQAMLQSAVMSDIDTKELTDKGLAAGDPSYTDYDLEYEASYDDDKITWDEDGILVRESGAVLQLTFDTDDLGELYVQFNGLVFTPMNSYETMSDEDYAELTRYEHVVEKYEEDYASEVTLSQITASDRDGSTAVTVNTNYSKYAEGREDYLLNLGYSADKRAAVSVRFSETGLYSFEDLSLIMQPMENLSAYVAARTEDVLQNVTFDNNVITGDITLDKTKILCLSLPYSDGWTAYVDGTPVKLIKTNVMCSGLLLSPGDHEIRLEYQTPYLDAGAKISAAGIALIVLCAAISKVSCRRNMRECHRI